MSTMVKIGGLFLSFMLIVLVVMDINATSQRKTELEDMASTSMCTVLKTMYLEQIAAVDKLDLEIAFIRSVVENSNTDSDLMIQIFTLSDQGLLDVSITSSFDHLNGLFDRRTLRKTMIVEDVFKEDVP